MGKFTQGLFSISLCALLGVANYSAAQSPADSKTANTLKAELESANTALNDLDAKALNCMNSFNMNLGEAAALLCDEFIRAIDGDLLASYIEHCNTLKIWRDEFILDIQNSVANLENSKENSADNLALVVGIEYSCGENALKERTVYVVSAFNTLSGRTLLNQSPQLSIQRSLDRRLADLAQQSRLKSRGQSLQNSIQQQGQRQQEATQQQNQRLEAELIRQQINNPQ
ncbi:MAG: hypothetical protein ACJAY7_001119 [Pseudohongiellaceae bacterium]|jgi:hypothetical protein